MDIKNSKQSVQL